MLPNSRKPIPSSSLVKHNEVYIWAIGLLLLLCTTVEGRQVGGGGGGGGGSWVNVEYRAVNCRKHSAFVTDFGAKGDGKTLNTNAFQSAVDHLSKLAPDGGAQLIVPPGRWLTGSFSLTSHFTLYLHKDAVLLASQSVKDYPVLAPLPSYGKGRDAPAGNNGTIDGQGEWWWEKYKAKELTETRPYLIELMYSNNVQITNLTLRDSPNWNVHPVYCSDLIIHGLTILAPTHSKNTDGIDPDSCSNVWIENNYIVSGDDCIAIKSGWDEYGIKFNMPTQHVIIRHLTCISPTSATIALGSEMSGGIRDVRAEHITAIDTESGVRIKTSPGRGAFVKDIYVRQMTMKTMKYVFWMTGHYGSDPDNHFNPRALPDVENINYRDMVAENVTMAANLEGIKGDAFKGVCVSNVTIGLSKKPKEIQWNCTDVVGVTSRVTPRACGSLRETNGLECPFPEDKLPIESVQLRACLAPALHK
ncbi:hypothetical protein Cgig2_007878 [Carnegiea gigantea]|uniref:Polygalacturonase n=1 Tax=Carnegiea gigantea TaxID=171969 RepID=A0A9Q1KEJ1_9CARY|nr:hypothetical protein Cgig2_007878 [Carnegiea gigantea]